MSGEVVQRVADRKLRELQAKIAALGHELGRWQSLADKPPFDKHYSQLVRLTTQLASAIGTLEKELCDASGSAVTLLGAAQTMERDVLDLHRVWDFFRGKFLLRAAPMFADFLAIADDFAWACYEPAVTRATGGRKEPPLTFFNTEAIPFAMPRDAPYTVEGDELTNATARDLLQALPVPVIGIPWYQINHLPDLLVVAHEVGHHVEDDLGLTDLLHQAVDAAALGDHAGAWHAWIGETFADIFATLAVGPAYALALMAFLIDDPQVIADATLSDTDWGDYPTPALRLRVVTATIDARLKPEDRGADYTSALAAWKAAVPTHAMADFDVDCEKVVKEVLKQQVGKSAISRLVDFASVHQSRVTRAANAALDPALSFGTTDPRELVAASIVAFARTAADADAERAAAPQKRLVAHLTATRLEGKRSESVKRWKASDAAAGGTLLEQLRKTRG